MSDVSPPLTPQPASGGSIMNCRSTAILGQEGAVITGTIFH
jgi:hypothetical protein